VEQHLYRNAAAVVTLTSLHAEDVIDGAFGAHLADTVAVIPTCADYEEFTLARKRSEDSIPREHAERLRGKVVLGIVGSINRYYDVQATLAFARLTRSARKHAHLLVLNQQETAWREAVVNAGFVPADVTITGASHDKMPDWLRWIDWGLLLLPDRASKRGSMPTKLAEFFAAGVRPIAHGCNSEVTSWVRRAGSGLVLEDLTPRTLETVARTVATTELRASALEEARRSTEQHFGLKQGIERYATLLQKIVRQSASASAGAGARACIRGE
jgi:glycosyltransferase involved in cell wall biosynthesis